MSLRRNNWEPPPKIPTPALTRPVVRRVKTTVEPQSAPAQRLTAAQIKRLDTKWSMDVKNRDDWICQRCLGPGSQAHHLIRRGVREFRWCLDNGATLCATCHEIAEQRMPAWKAADGHGNGSDWKMKANDQGRRYIEAGGIRVGSPGFFRRCEAASTQSTQTS